MRVDGGQRTHTAEGLACGTNHHFYVTAHNDIGGRRWLRCGGHSKDILSFHIPTYAHSLPSNLPPLGSSGPSNTVEGQTKGRAPRAPSQFQFITSNSSAAVLYLSQWADGGCPITHYTVQRRARQGDPWHTGA